jgi:predicted nucleic-acid-binding protein
MSKAPGDLPFVEMRELVEYIFLRLTQEGYVMNREDIQTVVEFHVEYLEDLGYADRVYPDDDDEDWEDEDED